MANPAARKWPSAASLLLGIGLSIASSAWAGSAGQVTHLSGVLSVKRSDGATKLLAVKSEVLEGDLLSTQQDTYARIKFADGGEVVLRPNTELKVESFSFNQAKPESDNMIFSMLKGGLRAVTGLIGKRNKDKVNYNTATATIGIRGTHFGALLCNNDCGAMPSVSGKPPENGLHLDVVNGAILVKNNAGSQMVNAGQFGYVKAPDAPPVIVPPQQGVQVTMPPNIAQNTGDGQGVGKGKTSECAVQ